MTARADTEVAAANLALALLRQPPIGALTEANARARAVNAVFAAARDAALSLRWWNFATGWQLLSADPSATRAGPLKSVYPLPADCVRVRFVSEAEDAAWEVAAYKSGPVGTEAEVSVLATNIAEPVICYTRRIEAVRLWSPDFLIAFSCQCAAFAGPQLGASATRVQSLQGEAESWKEDAAQADARERSKEQVSRTTSWIASRRRGGSAGTF